jgi:adenine deaminase
MSGSGDALVTRLYLGLALVLGLVVTSAGADHVAFTDLEGHVINATIVRNQVVRREGRQASIQVNQQWKIVIGPGESIETTVASTVQTPRGQRKSKPRTGTLILGETQPIRSQGGGHGAIRGRNSHICANL